MLSIGEFSNICKVSTKTLRYYAEIRLLEPQEIKKILRSEELQEEVLYSALTRKKKEICL